VVAPAALFSAKKIFESFWRTLWGNDACWIETRNVANRKNQPRRVRLADSTGCSDGFSEA
jgi:hypothetical protein